jgi:hypothetical protein
MALFAKFRDMTRLIGLGNACLLAASRLANTLSRGRLRIIKYYFLTQPLAPMRGPPPSSVFSLAWVEDTCPLFSQVDRPPAVITARFKQGARCVAAIVEGAQLAGFLWFVVGPYDEDEVRARFYPRPAGTAAWDFDVTIMPRYRMSRLFSYLWYHATAELLSQGVTLSASRISAFNAASLAAHRRLGGKIVGKALFVCAGRWQLMKSSIPPRWHLSWREDQRPNLEIASGVDLIEPR